MKTDHHFKMLLSSSLNSKMSDFHFNGYNFHHQFISGIQVYFDRVLTIGDYMHYIIVDSGCFGNKMLALNLETHLSSVTLSFTIKETSCFQLNKKQKEILL